MFRLAVECAADPAAAMRCAVSCLPSEFFLCRIGAHPLGGSQDPSGRVLDDPVMASHLYGATTDDEPAGYHHARVGLPSLNDPCAQRPKQVGQSVASPPTSALAHSSRSVRPSEQNLM